jgi:glutamyl-tRNA reductase
VGGRAVPLEALDTVLTRTDIVVASTAARNPVITRAIMAQAFPHGIQRPLLMVDIAIPRDVDPAVGDLPNVFLYNVDDLREIVDDHLRRRLEEVPEARRLILSQQDEFRRWFHGREAGPLIQSLRARAEELRREETERLLRRMGHLPAEDRARLEAFTRRLVNKLLHDPTVLLRDGVGRESEELVGAVRRLYGLAEGEEVMHGSVGEGKE